MSTEVLLMRFLNMSSRDMKIGCFALASLGLYFGLAPGGAVAQIKVDVPGVSVNVGSGGKAAVAVGGGSSASNTSGAIDADADIEGVTIINGEVSIDGEKVPHGKVIHKAKRSGKSYRITWGKNGNVSVEEK